ncbi:MAG: NADH-quinone oxidoreductase subunit NuoH [Aggregatilineales bacterium]
MSTVTQDPSPRPKVQISRGWINLLLIFVVLGVVSLVLFGIASILTNPDSIFGRIWESILGTINNVLTFIFDPNRLAGREVVQCRAEAACSTIQSIIFSIVFVLVVLTGFAYTTLLERRFIAFFQQRVGPNRAGPKGLLQPLADAIKLIFKEDIEPSGADKWVWRLAPMIKAIPPLILLAVVPLGPDLMIPWFDGRVYQVPMGLADVNVGVLWILAIASIGTYGVVLAGWASNNKYAALGGLRATSQMLSYELSLGLTMAVPVLIVGSMSLGDIIYSQTYFYQWFIFQNPLAAGILFLALLAEVHRAPFDLPEAEQELTQGYMTEYSGMRFAAFMMAEYLGMIGISVVFSALYLGGFQDGFGLVNNLPILGPLVFIGKVILLLIVMIWARATLPRIRYDRLMSFGWKVMLPLALVAVMWTAVAVLIGDTLGSGVAYGIVTGAIFFVVVVGGWLALRRSGEIVAAPESLEDDPVITGERSGLGAVAIQVVGGLLAIPFVIYNFTLRALDSLASLADRGKDDDDKPDDKAIVPKEGSGAD